MNDSLYAVGDSWALRFERWPAHPPRKVWRAITEPGHLGRWYPFTATELDPRVGGIIRFRDEEGTELQAEITEFTPPKVFEFREHDEQTGTHVLRIELDDDHEGCRMIFTHTFADETWAEQMRIGWTGCLDMLTRTLNEFD